MFNYANVDNHLEQYLHGFNVMKNWLRLITLSSLIYRAIIRQQWQKINIWTSFNPTDFLQLGRLPQSSQASWEVSPWVWSTGYSHKTSKGKANQLALDIKSRSWILYVYKLLVLPNHLLQVLKVFQSKSHSIEAKRILFQNSKKAILMSQRWRLSKPKLHPVHEYHKQETQQGVRLWESSAHNEPAWCNAKNVNIVLAPNALRMNAFQ